MNHCPGNTRSHDIGLVLPVYSSLSTRKLNLKSCFSSKFIFDLKCVQVKSNHFLTRGQFWPLGIVVACVCPCVRVFVYQSLACPRDNLGPVQARIPKFGPKIQKTLVKVPIVLGGNWPWPSRSNLTSKSEFTPFWVCLHHNSSLIKARITKFGLEVQNKLVKIPIVLGCNWPWPSRSNLT